ncbi:MAG: hypothetical protein CL561_06955 [Alphaproteobacteria bacterium]|nr:hypothetical protein [Alphaproteobacteria bacterium]|tara:strand:+ start:4230 stop:5840 length:1611 start_codon:yes stop_codon:yes gene_type:complete
MTFRKLRLIALGVSAAAILGSPTAVSAQAVEPVGVDGALYLQNKLQEIIAQPNMGMTASGEVEVEAAGNYYAVTLPHIRLDIPTPPSQQQPKGGKFSFDFGIAAMNMVPTEVKGRYVFAQSLPTPWRFYTNDQEIFRLSIGKQKTNGIYDLPMNLATRLEAQYDNIVLTDAKTGKPVLAIDSVTGKGGYDEKKPGLYSGRLPIEVNGIKLYGGTTEPFLTVDKLKIYSGYTDLSRENMIKCVGQMQRVNKQIQSYVKTEQIVDPPVIAGYLDNALACMGILADGMEGGIVVEGVKVGPGLAAAAGMQNVSLNSLYMQSFFTDIFKEKMGIAMKFGAQNLNMQPRPPGFSDYAPNSFHVDIGVDNVPHAKLHEIVRGILGMYSQDAESLTANPAMIMMQVMTRLPQILNEAQSGFVANDVRISGKDWQAVLKGRVQSDINAIYGASGQGTLVFQNMDMLLKQIKAEAQDPNNPNAMGMMQIIAPLEMLHGLGKSDDKNGRIFEFEFTQQGNLMLNGQSVQQLLMPQAQQMQPAPAAQ